METKKLHDNIKIFMIYKNLYELCKVPMTSKFLCQDTEIVSLTDKCIIGAKAYFVCMNYDKSLMETEKFPDNIKFEKWTRAWCWKFVEVVELYVLAHPR